MFVSIAVHASFLLTSAPRGTSRIDLDAPFGTNKLDVTLLSRDSSTPARPVETEWAPLQPLPPYKPQGARKARLLEFKPVDMVPVEIDESDYLPLSRVTLRPSPLAPIAVPFPSGADAGASRTAKIVVFINEDGSVAKVALAKDQSASPFAIAALKTFEQARYRPALLNQTPVRVRVVIAVEFEDRQATREPLR
jgi:outer membrane biosynthesis protein TonB